MPERKRTDPDIEARVLSKSGRRCCLCFQLHQDFTVKHGQIAHLDRNPSNGAEENLAFFCMDHHSVYDSRTSQHKNFTLTEVLSARSRLYARVENSMAGAPPEKFGGPLPSQNGGVNFGAANTVHVHGDIVGGDKTSHTAIHTLRERGEELYVMIDKWLNGLAGYYLRRNSVMQGKLTYNQCLDLDIAEGDPPYDFGRIEFLIDLYFPSLRGAYNSVIEARTAVNRIATAHKHAYEDGDFDGTEFLRPFLAAQISVENRGEILKKQLVEVIRSQS